MEKPTDGGAHAPASRLSKIFLLMCNQLRARKTTLIDVVIPVGMTNPGRVAFQDQPLLRTQGDQTIRIDAIETFAVTALAISPLSNLPVVAVTDFPNAVLVLNVNGMEDFKFIPLTALNRVQDGTPTPFVRELFLLDGLERIDWSKSYVQYQAAPNAVQTAIVFQIYYRLLLPVKNGK